MGKGQRNKNQTEDVISAGTHLAAREEKNSVLKKVAIWIGAIAVIVFLLGMQVFNYFHDSGYKERHTVALSTDNYSVTSSDMMYFFGSTYQNMVTMIQRYGMDISSMIDTSKSLKAQTCSFDSSKTWFEYFMGSAEDSAKQVLTLCEAARAAGLDIDDTDRKTADSTIESLKTTAKNAGYSLKNYLKTAYGSAVSESDIRHAVELSSLADRYRDKCKNDADISDAVIDAAYEADPSAYDKVSYISYAFDYSDLMPKDDSDSETTAADTAAADSTAADTTAAPEEDPALKADAIEKSRKYADELAAIHDEDSFKAYIRNNMINVLGLSEDEADSQMANLTKTGVSKSDSDEKITWAFEAAAGDTKVFEDSSNEGVFNVLLVTAAKGRDETISSRNVRHILFKHDTYKDDTKVREVYDKWVADGASVEEFERLAAEYSEDPGSAQNGGLYENVTKGQMATEFDAWLFDDARKPGDHAIVETEDFGWHIMYYVGGVEGWKSEIISNIQSEAQSKAMNDATEKYTVTVNEDAIAALGA